MRIQNHYTDALIATLFIAAFSFAQAQQPAPTLEKQLESAYPLTTPTADNTQLVITGATLVLQKKGLSAGVASSKTPNQNTFKTGDPQIKAGAVAGVRRGLGGLSGLGGVPGLGGLAGVSGAAGSAAGAAGVSRGFVNGEKVFVTKIDIDRGKDTITFSLISDAFDAGRYTATLKIQFEKGLLGKGDFSQIQPTLDQVFQVAPADNQSAGAAQGGSQPTAPQQTTQAPAAAAQPTAPASEATLAPIAPPPPPPADAAPPKSIQVGQSVSDVVGIMGQPRSIVDLGARKIYMYDGIKVTFVDGKMTAAE